MINIHCYCIIELILVAVSTNSILVSQKDEDDWQFWLPKSEIEYEGELGEEIQVRMPLWLAQENNLVNTFEAGYSIEG